MWKFLRSGESKGESKGRSSAENERLDAIEQALEALQADIEGIRLEWATWYKKLSRLAGHITKTAKLDEPPPVDKRVNIDELTREEIARL